MVFTFHLCKAHRVSITFLFLSKDPILQRYPNRYSVLETQALKEMALNGAAPPRGSAAATAANLRRRKTGGTGGAAGGTAGNMLQFYTDDAPGLKISPNVVLVMSIGFIAFVAVLHVMGKLYFVRKEA
uniref:Protein transport protein Sec61 subunit beta n=2 Tax=Helianthus annuus TaxID=4232 RepID=A0A251V4K1_HELAN